MAPPPVTLSADVEEVGEVKFSMMTSEDIRAASAVEITSTELFNGSSPVPGGLYDPRMGAYEYGSRCHTCLHTNARCTGHFGHIELAAPVFNIETKDWVKKFLKCVCSRCSALMARADDPDIARLARRKLPNSKRFAAVVAACTKAGVKTCPACNARRADSVAWDKKASCMELVWKGEGDAAAERMPLDAGQVDAIFRRVTVADATTTGILRPDALLLSVLPVPPIAVRPPAKNSSGQRRDDDLTIKLADIVKSNNLLKARSAAGATAETLTALTTLLQCECITYINNSATGGVAIAKVKATNRPLRSVTSRLKGKEGRIRGNLSGKRVDQSARSVITPDPNISVEELGMPLRVAKTLSMPEVVRVDNRERLQAAVENGPTEYPGAVYVRVASSGALLQLKRVEARRRVALEIGDVVHRHLLDGDVVLFNRQPSLHRMSMMAHRVRVMPYDTFRLSVMVTPPYNADFDGDEMNAHCPQSATTATELRMLSGVASQIVTPREHAPIIGVVQDVALGLHLITAADVRVGRKAACNMLAHLSTCDGDVGPEVWTGRDLLSALLPRTLHLETGRETIEFGRLLDGQLNKDSYQRSTNGILHAVYNDNGPRRAVRLLDDTQNLACDWLMTNGFSVGIGDLVCRPELLVDIGAAMATARRAVSDIFLSIHTGDFKNDTFQSDAEYVEALALKEVEAMFKVVGAGAIEDSRARSSRLLSMVDVGAKSKGKTMNVCQMVGSLGQQQIDFRRVPLSFEGRVLPHFARYDDGCDARGMVESSFVQGLTPQEFFMHAMAGREGLIDTAVKSVTGDTPVVFLEDGRPRYAQIGDWIDGHLASRTADVAHFEERRMELLDLQNDVFIPTTDEHGVVTWGRVTAMTRHDPGTQLFEIRTAAGKRVIVTESKSVLVWRAAARQFVDVAPADIAPGDFMPVTKRLAVPPVELTSDPASGIPLVPYVGRVMGRYLANRDRGGAVTKRAAAEPRTVPDVAFCATEPFVCGILAGYFADPPSDPSRRLADGIAMLCSRIGVFAIADGDDGVLVAPSSVAVFVERVGVLPPISEIDPPTIRDVVLDAVLEIRAVGVERYPKVYDLTIPTTLNFGLANGLQVRDTSETGYLQRKLIKALEDCKVSYDRSVRGANGNVVQFMYGEDGMDACSIETHTLPTVAAGGLAEMTERFMWAPRDLDGMRAVLAPALHERLSADGSVWRRLNAHFRALVADKDLVARVSGTADGDVAADKIYQPIAFDRILRAAARANAAPGGAVCLDLHPAAALDAIDGLVAKMGVGPAPSATPLLAALVRAFLSPKALLREYGMTSAGLDAAVASIERAFMSALCSPSEMVGILAAQSLAEPLTQMVLNTFHTTGIGSATKQLGGVPRIKELLSFTRNPKTPVMSVYLTRADRAAAFAMCETLRSVTVADIMTSTALLYDAGEDPTFGGDAEAARVAALYRAFGVDDGDAALSPWLLRIDFDRRKMIDAGVHMHDVHRALTSAFTAHVVHTDDGARDLVMRLRPPATAPDMMSELVAFEEHSLAVRVAGVPDVRAAYDFPDKSRRYDAVTRTTVARADEHMVTTQGANFGETLGLDGVDAARTSTNDLRQVLDVLGIEATRAALLAELTERYAPDTGSYVNHRHLALLVDFMTQSGDTTAIDRHGINAGDIGPLAKCSFEQPVDNLVKAAVFRESDKVEGVAASIILGQVSRCGTGDGDVVLDQDAYAQIDGDQAPAADLRISGQDPANEPALDNLLAVMFSTAAARDNLAIDPAVFVGAA